MFVAVFSKKPAIESKHGTPWNVEKMNVWLERFICNQDLRGNFQKDIP